MNEETNDFREKFLAATAASAFRRLAKRAATRIDEIADANERANAAIKTLSLFYSERAALTVENQNVDADWRPRFDAFVERVRGLIADVENRAERAYLRRIFLEAALKFAKFESETAKIDKIADKTLAEIDDEEERQNALFVYSSALARRVGRLDDFAATRAKALELADELDDLRQFEEVVATTAIDVLFNRARRKPEESADATADVATVYADVETELNELESEEGFLRFFSALPGAPDAFGDGETRQTAAIRKAFEAETRRRLTRLLDALDSGKDADGEPLDDADLEDWQALAQNVEFASPFFLEDGDFWRSFALRFRRFEPLKTLLNAAENAEKIALETETASKNDLRRVFFPKSAEFYSDEKAKTLDAIRRLGSDPAFDASPRRKIDALLELAQVEFSSGDKANAKNAVRDVFANVSKIATAVERAGIYRRIVETNLAAGLKKAAKKTAEFLRAELDAIEPGDVRDREKSGVAALFWRVEPLAEALSGTLGEFASPSAKFAAKAVFDLERIFEPARQSDAATDAEDWKTLRGALESLVGQAVVEIAEYAEADEEVFALVELGEKIARIVAPFVELVA